MTTQAPLFERYGHAINRDNNFDLVRYLLAFGVLIAHFNELCGANVWWFVTGYDRVGGFFALSGFLLLHPLVKGCGWRHFFMNRLWRLMPSYCFVVVVAAVALSAVSTLPPVQYFTSGGFWQYLAANLSFLNFLHPDLPGVFSRLAEPAVNGALWTMKVEWQLTLMLPLLLWIIKRYDIDLRKAMAVILAVSVVWRVAFFILWVNTERSIYEILGRQFGGQAIYYFLGALIYTFYGSFQRSRRRLLWVAVAVYVVFRFFIESPVYYIVAHPFVITLLIMGVGLIPGNVASRIDRGHNISYEIYLCHCPIVQLMASFGAVERWGVAGAFCAVLGCTLVAAVITYALVGRLYLKRKRRLASATN